MQISTGGGAARKSEHVSLLLGALGPESGITNGSIQSERHNYHAATTISSGSEKEDGGEGDPPAGLKWYRGVSQDSVILIAAVVGLMLATMAERVTFKMSVDKMTPFRLVLTQMIFLISVAIYGLITLLKKGLTHQVTAQMHQFPHSKLILIAVLDTVQFACFVASAAGVTPTMTVILVHASTPVIVLGSKFVFPDRTYTGMQIRGVAFISAAIVIGFLQQCWLVYTKGAAQVSGAMSNFTFVAAAVLQGATTLYKEKAIIDWMQPIDVHFLSTWLFFYQVLTCIVLSPAFYLLQGVSSNWYGFPINSMSINIRDGWMCIQGRNTYYSQSQDDSVRVQEEPYDSQYQDCEYSFCLIIAYVLANVLVLECIDRVLQTGMHVMGRANAAAVLMAVVVLGVYDTQVDRGDQFFGSTIGIADLLSVVALLVGIELYGRDAEPCEIVVGGGGGQE